MKKISLRPLLASDCEAAFKWTGDSQVTRSLFWDAHESVQATEEFLKSVAEPHPWFMAICLNDYPVGAITLDKGKGRSDCRAELGYVLAKDNWGQGIATEAIRQCLTRGFEDINVSRIEAFVDPENIGSFKALEKAGLKKEATLANYVVHRGQVRDRFVYAALKEL